MSSFFENVGGKISHGCIGASAGFSGGAQWKGAQATCVKDITVSRQRWSTSTLRCGWRRRLCAIWRQGDHSKRHNPLSHNESRYVLYAGNPSLHNPVGFWCYGCCMDGNAMLCFRCGPSMAGNSKFKLETAENTNWLNKLFTYKKKKNIAFDFFC